MTPQPGLDMSTNGLSEIKQKNKATTWSIGIKTRASRTTGAKGIKYLQEVASCR